MSSKPINLIGISNVSGIIHYVNNLNTHNFKPENSLSRWLDGISNIVDINFQQKFLDLYPQTEVYKKGEKLYRTKYKIVGVDASSIIINLTQCIDIVQGLRDSAMKNNTIDPYKEFYFIALIGALEELCYLIDTARNELLPYSHDNTHLRKTLMAVYSNASKLISLEKLLKNIPEAEFEQYLSSMKPQEQDFILQEFLLPKFEINWILGMTADKQQKIFNLLSSDDNFKIEISKLNNIWDNYTIPERENFLKHIKDTLIGRELRLLTGEE